MLKYFDQALLKRPTLLPKTPIGGESSDSLLKTVATGVPTSTSADNVEIGVQNDDTAITYMPWCAYKMKFGVGEKHVYRPLMGRHCAGIVRGKVITSRTRVGACLY